VVFNGPTGETEPKHMNKRTGHARNQTLHLGFMLSKSNHWGEDPHRCRSPLCRFFYVSSYANFFSTVMCGFAGCGRGLGLTICG